MFFMKERAEKMIAKLPGEFEAALILTPQNRFYFLDFDSHDAGTLLILKDKMYFIIDSRYIEVAQNVVKDVELVLQSNALMQVEELLQQHHVSQIYVENKITLAQYEEVKNVLAGIHIFADDTLSKTIDNLRAIKDADEIERMREAQRVTDACFTHILPYIQEGVREIDIMLEMEHFMRSHGAEKVAFDTICVAGANSSLPHGVPGENKVKKGDFITMDFGAKVKGYCADMTRTVAFGALSSEQEKVYDMVLRAHLAGIATAKAGMRGCDVDKVARDIITQEGYGAYFGHGLGHAVGIDIHEDPRFSPACKTVIQAGMMMTIEPGCYLPGKFGVRIEDTTLITETGCDPLPKSPKNLIIL